MSAWARVHILSATMGCRLFAFFGRMAVGAGLLLLPGAPMAAAALIKPAVDVTVRVAAGASTRRVPASFIGISVEYNELRAFERSPAFPRLLHQLAIPGSGPLLLRVGGQSADDTYWPFLRRPSDPAPYRLAHSLTLSGNWLSALASLVSAAKLRVMLNLNLAAHSPQMAARFTAAAMRALPAHTLTALELGNEPDLYRIGMVGFTHRPEQRAAPGEMWMFRYTSEDYRSQFVHYARALRSLPPAIALAGPSVSRPTQEWMAAALAAERGRPRGMLTAHRYPFWSGAKPDSSAHASIAGLLSDSSTAGLAGTVVDSAAAAHRAGRTFRITELGSSAGSVAGVTDTFATALWIPDALFSMMSAGVDGVQVHLRSRYSNSALTVKRTGLLARPLFYGMVLAARALGPGARLVPVDVAQPLGASVKSWAVRIRGNNLRLLLINRADAVRVSVPVPARGPATVQRLLAPRVSSTSGQTLAGQSLAPDGTWQGALKEPTVRLRAGQYPLTVPARSAALLSFKLRSR